MTRDEFNEFFEESRTKTFQPKNSNNNNNNMGSIGSITRQMESTDSLSTVSIVIKDELMKFREFYGTPVAEKRLEKFARILSSRGITADVVVAAVDDMVINYKTFPSLSEIIESCRKYIVREGKKLKGCPKCNGSGVFYLNLMDEELGASYDYVYRCNCELGNSFTNYMSFDKYLLDRQKHGETNEN